MAIQMPVPRSAAHRSSSARLSWLASAAGAIALLAAVAADGRRGLAPANLAQAQADTVTLRIDSALRDLAKAAGVPLWMTEVSHGELDPRSFDALRGRAVHIHDELTMADASAYFGMNNMWDSFSQAEHFRGRDQGLYSEADSLVLIDLDLGKVVITGMGYAIGHWGRFLPRGAVRVAADATDPLVQVSAFLDEAGSRLVLVAINNALEARAVDVAAAGLQLRGALSGIRSMEAERWAPLAPLPSVGSGGFADRLPARSVTTYVADVALASVEATATYTLSAAINIPIPRMAEAPAI